MFTPVGLDFSRLRLHLPPLSLLEADLCRSSLKQYCNLAWKYVQPHRPLIWNWHLDAICDVLTSITHGELRNVIFNVPPGTMKSMLVSVLWPSWEWTFYPWYGYLTASYSDENTIRDNLRVRDIVTSEWYQKTFWDNVKDPSGNSMKVTLSSDQSAKIKFATTAKGWRIASSIKGAGTGEHPNRIIIDDPLKAQERNSDVKLAECEDYLANTVSTRRALDVAVVLIMQRLHMRDPSGYLLSKGGFEHVCFPMRYVAVKENPSDPRNIPDPRDIRTTPGELLWPEMWPESKVLEEESHLSEWGIAGQLQQNPLPEGGGLFKRDHFEIVDMVSGPIDCVRCRGWDIAESEPGANDWTWGVKLALHKQTGTIYVEHAVFAQQTLVDILIKQTAINDGKHCKIREGAGSGKAVAKARSILLAGYDYDTSPETDSKVERAMPFCSQTKQLNVKVCRGPWNERYLDEMCGFPVGRHDDATDATSNAANELLGVGGKKKVKIGR